MIKVIRILLVAIVAFLLYVNSRPSTFHVERAITIAAPAESLYPRLADFHAWNDWSPWAKLDPGMKQQFGGTDGAVGANYYWIGNKDVGEGRMTLAEVQPPSTVKIELEFLKPFKSTNVTTFGLAPDAGGTRVTWAMDGPMNFMAKGLSVFASMDKMVGKDFEKGLANLKQLSEAPPAAN